MTVDDRKNGAVSRRMRAGALAGLLALALCACGSSGQPQQPATSVTAPVGPSSGPLPTAMPSLPSLSTLPLPSGGETTLRGTVTQGVESGCVVLVDDSGAVLANLQGWDLRSHPFDSRVEVTGTFQADLMTTCQQGTPFEVRNAIGL